MFTAARIRHLSDPNKTTEEASHLSVSSRKPCSLFNTHPQQHVRGKKNDTPHLPLHHLDCHHDGKRGQDDVEELLPGGLDVGPQPPLLPFRLLAPVQLALPFRRRCWR